jgi:hypothetical protein
MGRIVVDLQSREKREKRAPARQLQHNAEGFGYPWSVPRLRGRGEQGERVMQVHITVCALYGFDSPLAAHKSRVDNALASSSASFATASQARQRSAACALG